MTLLLFALLLATSLQLQEILIPLQRSIRQESQKDAEFGKIAEELCSHFQKIEELEKLLDRLRQSCTISYSYPALAPTIRASAQALLLMQKKEFLSIETKRIGLLVKKNRVFYKKARSTPSQGCDIPGPLEWPTPPDVLMEIESNQPRAGIQIQKLSQKSEARWTFHHPGVQPL